jgi:hypothetical protein
LLSRSVSVAGEAAGELLWAAAKVALNPMGTALQSKNSNTRECRWN